ncbi:uncharacterized protein G2W53_007825 [Senna tora]|uniref:Uncharacterized protein n=1 Tax=Senna tora TaxID=362788 RepID=A0A834X7C7_9FABA|nr:uncharacterized protein G2W53_007825 [Senna tora]
MKDAEVNSNGGNKMAATDTTSLYVQRISKMESEEVKLKDDLMTVKGDLMMLKMWIIAHSFLPIPSAILSRQCKKGSATSLKPSITSLLGLVRFLLHEVNTASQLEGGGCIISSNKCCPEIRIASNVSSSSVDQLYFEDLLSVLSACESIPHFALQIGFFNGFFSGFGNRIFSLIVQGIAGILTMYQFMKQATNKCLMLKHSLEFVGWRPSLHSFKWYLWPLNGARTPCALLYPASTK